MVPYRIIKKLSQFQLKDGELFYLILSNARMIQNLIAVSVIRDCLKNPKKIKKRKWHTICIPRDIHEKHYIFLIDASSLKTFVENDQLIDRHLKASDFENLNNINSKTSHAKWLFSLAVRYSCANTNFESTISEEASGLRSHLKSFPIVKSPTAKLIEACGFDRHSSEKSEMAVTFGSCKVLFKRRAWSDPKLKDPHPFPTFPTSSVCRALKISLNAHYS